MSAAGIGVAHLKIHGFAGDHLLARCEDDGCTVDAGGRAGCGRLACPSCGFSGSNVHETGAGIAYCTCGNAWAVAREHAHLAA